MNGARRPQRINLGPRIRSRAGADAAAAHSRLSSAPPQAVSDAEKLALETAQATGAPADDHGGEEALRELERELFQGA